MRLCLSTGSVMSNATLQNDISQLFQQIKWFWKKFWKAPWIRFFMWKTHKLMFNSLSSSYNWKKDVFPPKMLILYYSAVHRTRMGLLYPITRLFLDRFLIFWHVSYGAWRMQVIATNCIKIGWFVWDLWHFKDKWSKLEWEVKKGWNGMGWNGTEGNGNGIESGLKKGFSSF